jgi:hypothetical protein
MERKPQSLKNHAKFDPVFHFFLSPVALILLGSAIYYLVRHPERKAAVILLGVVWAIVALFKIRLYALKVQDRVIRLEERLRYQRILSPELQAKTAGLTEQQIIALRFASDGELPGLVEKALAGNLPQKEIKPLIQNWRPDYWRV